MFLSPSKKKNAADESRPSLETALERFFLSLPDALGSSSKNQRIPLSSLEFDRVLFGAFPSYARAPLRTAHDRVLHAGDAAGVASPLSFGGFGAMLRHLPRLAVGIPEAIEASRASAEAAEAAAAVVSTVAATGGGGGGQETGGRRAAAASSKPLGKGALSALTPYSPSLSSTWLFASAMRLLPGSVVAGGVGGEEQEEEEEKAKSSSSSSSLAHRRHHRRRRRHSHIRRHRRKGSFLPPDHVSRLLSANFRVLSLLGTWALGPFVTERVRPLPLAATMAGMGAAAPLVIVRVLRQVGPLALARWFWHAGLLAAYAALRVVVAPLRAWISEERRRRGTRRRRATTTKTMETAEEEEEEGEEDALPPPPPPQRGLFSLVLLAVALHLRALRARAFAALARFSDALDYGSGHDGCGGGGGSGSGGVRIIISGKA